MNGLTCGQALATAQALGLERLDAQLLLLYALGKPDADRAWLLAHDTDSLAAETWQHFHAQSHRRASGAPLAYIVIPVLLGGLAPVFAALPGRFQVHTRFHAQHFVKTLDEAIRAMGYHRAESVDGQSCYQPQARIVHWKENAIAIKVSDHAIVVVGPVFVLRMLQQRLTG